MSINGSAPRTANIDSEGEFAACLHLIDLPIYFFILIFDFFSEKNISESLIHISDADADSYPY